MWGLRLFALIQPRRSQDRLRAAWPEGQLELELGRGILGGCLGHGIFCAFSLLPALPTHTAAVTLRPFVSHCLLAPFVLISDAGEKGQ